jgi:hypothetical protein
LVRALVQEPPPVASDALDLRHARRPARLDLLFRGRELLGDEARVATDRADALQDERRAASRSGQEKVPTCAARNQPTRLQKWTSSILP